MKFYKLGTAFIVILLNVYGWCNCAAEDLNKTAEVPPIQAIAPQNLQGDDLCKYLQLVANALLLQELLWHRADYYCQIYQKHSELSAEMEFYKNPSDTPQIIKDTISFKLAIKLPQQTLDGFAFLLRHRDILFDQSLSKYKFHVADILLRNSNPDFQAIGRLLLINLKYKDAFLEKKGVMFEFDSIFHRITYEDLKSLKDTQIRDFVLPFMCLKEYYQKNEGILDGKYPMVTVEDYYSRVKGMYLLMCEELQSCSRRYAVIRERCHQLFANVMQFLSSSIRAFTGKSRLDAYKYLKTFCLGERLPDTLTNLNFEKYIKTEEHESLAKSSIKQLTRAHFALRGFDLGDLHLTSDQMNDIPEILRYDPVIEASLKASDSKKLPTQPKNRLKGKKRKTPKSGSKVKKGSAGSVHAEIEQIDIKKPAIEIEPAGPVDCLSLEVEVKDTAQLPQEQAPSPSSEVRELVQPAPAPASQEELPQKNKIKPSALQKVPKKPVLCAASKNALVVSAATTIPVIEGDYLIPQKTDSTKTTIFDARYNVELCMYISQDKRRPVFSFIDYTDTIKLWLADPKKTLRKKGYTDPESLWYRPDCRADLPTSDSHSLLRLELLHAFSKKIDAYIQRFGILGQIEEHPQTADSESGAEITTLTIPGHVLHCSTGTTEPCLFVYYFHPHNNKWFHRNIVFRPYGLMTNEFLNNGFFKVPYPECNQ